MTMSEPVPSQCKVWMYDQKTLHPPHDVAFLSEVERLGFTPFVGPGGLFGAQSDNRVAMVIYRGRKGWELSLQSPSSEEAKLIQEDIESTMKSAIEWLKEPTGSND